MNVTTEFVDMFKDGPCDLVFLIEKRMLKRWVDAMGAESFIGERSYNPKDYTLKEITSKFFGFTLSDSSYYTLVTRDDSGKWKVVLNEDDMVSNPLGSSSLKRYCKVAY